MTEMLIEENKEYALDCTNALWKSGEIHDQYHAAKLHLLKDADFAIETPDNLIIIEYKNSAIPGASSPNSFNPMEDKTINSVVRKYYDSLHYLTLVGKTKPKRYVYVVETPTSDYVMRARLRERISKELPFELQKNIGMGRRLIEDVDVLSIEEWNRHEQYGKFPFVKISEMEKAEQ